MSFDSLITPTRLRALAGHAYDRGTRYWQEGRAQYRERVGDGIAGTVTGGAEYEVRVFTYGRELASMCTCPAGDAGRLCKHAVALVLEYQAATAEKPAPAAPNADVFATRTQLDTWCEENGVAHELQLSADVLLDDVVGIEGYPHLAMVLRNVSLQSVGSLEGAARFVGVRQLQQPVAAAAAQRLRNAVADLRLALDEEGQPRRLRADAPSSVHALWDRLVAYRAQVRRNPQAAPRSHAARMHVGSIEHDEKSSALVWRERTKIVIRYPSWSTQPLVARLAFTMPDGPPTASCTCTTSPTAPAACTHVLALVDATLDLLANPANEARATVLADELLRPPWQRALAELATRDDPTRVAPGAAVGQVEVWWHIDTEFGTTTLTPLVKKALKRGGYSAGTRMTAVRLLDDHASVLGEADTRIAEQLAGWVPSKTSTYPARAFAALVGHPRAVHANDPDIPLAVRRVPLGFTAVAAGDEIRLEPSVDGARFSPRLLAPLLRAHAPSEPLLVLELEHARLLLIDVGDDARHMWNVLERHGNAFPPDSHTQLLERLSRLETKLPLDVPPELKGVRLDAKLTTVLRMRLVRDGALEIEAFVRPAPHAPLFPPASGPRDVMVIRPDGSGVRGYVRRDISSEIAIVRGSLARLPELDVAEEGPPMCFSIADPDAALALVARVQTPPPDIEAEWVDVRPTVYSAPPTESLRVKIDAKRDWFGIAGEMKVPTGRLELAIILDALRRQRRFVRIDDTRWLELSDAIREHLGPIADRTFATRNQLELSPGAVPAVRALAAAGIRVDAAPAWQDLTDRLVSSAKLRPRPPAALASTLRNYQVEGHAWLSRLAAWGAGGCLADDMGLGKTIQAIAVLLDRAKTGPALVLAPTSVTLNWVDELKRFAPTLRPVVLGEQDDRTATVAKLTKKDVLIVSYGLLVRDVELLASRTFGTLVVDEAQALKNPATQRAKAARALKAEFRIALTGTPLENHLGELWSLFSVVFPNLLGSWDQFRERFALPIERDQNADARFALSRVIQPFLLRRTKAEVARELPPRTEIQVPIALSKDEAALYEDARLAAVAHLAAEKKTKDLRDEQRRFEVLAALTRLRLLASHPRLYDSQSQVASSKMQRLLELIEELRDEGHRALVFSQFTSHLELVRGELTEAGVPFLYLDGSTPAGERKRLIDRFQDGEADIFLISLKAGGTGINLTGADYVIHLDPWWNPAVEDQATDRAHRIGQTKPVTVYRLIARGTVEERILALHKDKRALVSSILDGTDVAARLTTRDLLALLSESAS
ncbi:MAG: DEAD/DEAH box helicase [Kofleriaceae bacterium]|nr:DEAD/DEAH box helicase [Kofleriaceae bacterium]